MITALIILAVANAFFCAGYVFATYRASVIEKKFIEENHYPETAEQVIALGWFKTALIYDCPEGHAVSGVLCDLPGLWMCIERLHYAEEMEEPLYDYVISHNQQLNPKFQWLEVEIQNDCGYGCKIYENQSNGRRVLAHNSAYGCRQ